MRFSKSNLAGAFLSTALLAACGGANDGLFSSPPSSVTSPLTPQSPRSVPTRSGLPVQSGRSIQIANHPGESISPDGGLRDLYVISSNAFVEIFKNKTWTNLGSFYSGINSPNGDWVDKLGDLYVANFGAATITEYAPHAMSPSFTYSRGMCSPANVTTDSHGNVYEADSCGNVNEYAHRSNKVINTCALPGSPAGVAVDGSGDVFVDQDTNVGPDIVEYRGSLKGCTGSKLRAPVGFPAGMVLDKHNNLIICDQFRLTVDVIDPPYKRIAGTLGSGYDDPQNVTLNKSNTQAYVADLGDDSPSGVVDVLSYPSGSKIATIMLSSGNPWGAVDGQNFVP